jgi:hypothetical protein
MPSPSACPLPSPLPSSPAPLLSRSPPTNRRADSKGRTVDFKNTLIILTSNVGSSVIEKGGGGIGFQLDNSEEDSSYNRIKSLVNEELKQYFRWLGGDGAGGQYCRACTGYQLLAAGFAAVLQAGGRLAGYQARLRAITATNLPLNSPPCFAPGPHPACRPEFLNRLDEIIVFRQLTKVEVKQIADIMLKQVFKRAEEKGIKIDVTGGWVGGWAGGCAATVLRPCCPGLMGQLQELPAEAGSRR